MSANVSIVSTSVPSLKPVTQELSTIKFGGSHLHYFLVSKFEDFADDVEVELRSDFWPGDEFVAMLKELNTSAVVRNKSGEVLLKLDLPGKKGKVREFSTDEGGSFQIIRPWQLLDLNEKIVGAIEGNHIEGIIRPGVNIDGFIRLGLDSVILPGVYIEGNVAIGKNCKIGPNCYIRGNTSIGDNCHIGQAVEIKNSLIMDKVSAGHLSYIGDSVVSSNVNFGAGTIVSNLRHDNGNHRFLTEDAGLVDTGRRKFGMIVGENVHTGIRTTVYPGRQLAKGRNTLPGEIVKK